jgi:hypothetical protein
MASVRADFGLVIGYDLKDEASYSSFTLMRRYEDGTLEVIESETVPGPITRGQLLTLCIESIKKYNPKLVSVKIGEGRILDISQQTVEEILAGTKQWTDLMIGS